MPREVLILSSARADMASAYEWYEDQEPGLGERFLKTLDDAFDRIATFPLNYSVRIGAYRRSLMQTFPYAVYYKLHYKLHEEQIIVGYIFHTSRNPKRLPKRLG